MMIRWIFTLIDPIKSCAAIDISNGSWPINQRGLKYDREWLLLDAAHGTILTQKKYTLVYLNSRYLLLDFQRCV